MMSGKKGKYVFDHSDFNCMTRNTQTIDTLGWILSKMIFLSPETSTEKKSLRQIFINNLLQCIRVTKWYCQRGNFKFYKKSILF